MRQNTNLYFKALQYIWVHIMNDFSVLSYNSQRELRKQNFLTLNIVLGRWNHILWICFSKRQVWHRLVQVIQVSIFSGGWPLTSVSPEIMHLEEHSITLGFFLPGIQNGPTVAMKKWEGPKLRVARSSEIISFANCQEWAGQGETEELF